MELYALDGYKDIYECPACGYRERTGNRLGLGILGTGALFISLGMGLFAFLSSTGAASDKNKNAKQKSLKNNSEPLPSGSRYIFCQCCEQQIPSYSNFCLYCGMKRTPVLNK